MLDSLAKAGACLNSELEVVVPHEVPIDLVNDPWQPLRPRLLDLGRRARLGSWNRIREALQGVYEIDVQATLAWDGPPGMKLDRAMKQLLNTIRIGGIWTGTALWHGHPVGACWCRILSSDGVTHRDVGVAAHQSGEGRPSSSEVHGS